MNEITAGIAGVVLSLLGVFGIQFATAPSYSGGTGTLNQLQLWKSTAGRVELASSTATIRVPSLISLDCIGTDADGDFGAGTCTGGGGGSGGGPFSTSTNNQLVYNNAGESFLFTDDQRTATTTDSILELESDAATTTIAFVLSALNPSYMSGLKFYEGGTVSAGWLYDGSSTGDNNRMGFYDYNTSSFDFFINRGGGFLATGSSTVSAGLSVLNGTSTLSQYFPYLATAAGTHVAVDANGKLIATTSSSFSTTSANAWSSLGLGFSTTSADAWGSGKGYSTFAYLFPNDATTTLLNFNGGLTAFASSTIGNGTQTGGLTIFGGATTTGNLRVNGVLSLGTALNEIYGGTGQTTYSAGDLLYASGANTLTKLPVGGAGQVLKVTGGLPAWGADIASGGGGGATAWSTTTDSLAVYPTDTSNVIIVGSSATATANSIFEVFGRSYFSQSVGIATTSPGSLFSIGGVANFSANGSTLYSSLTLGNLTATSTVTLGQTTIANATTTTFAITGVPNALLATDANGNVYATTTISSLLIDTSGNWTGTFDGQEGAYYLANSFSTTSASNFSSLGLAFSTTSNDYWKSVNNFFSTTSSNYYSSVGLGFSTTSTSYFSSLGLAFSTTSADHHLSQNQGAAFSTTSAIYFTHSSTTIPKTYTSNIFTAGNLFLASTTIGGGTQAGGLTISGGATTTGNLVVQGSATTTNLGLTGLANALLSTNAQGSVVATTTLASSYLSGIDKGFFFSTTSANYWSSLGLGFSTTSADAWGSGKGYSTFAYLFPSNATSTLINFSGGLTMTNATATSLYITELTASRPVFTDANKRLSNTGTVEAIEAAVGSQNILLETEIDGCSELLALIDDETGTCGGLVFSTNPTFAGMIATSLVDFGGSALEIPNGTAPTADDPGEIAHDTSGNQLIVDDFVMASGVHKIFSLTVASTSRAFIDGGLLPIPLHLDGYTLTAIRCYVVGGTSKVVAIEDASANSSEDITCGTTATSDDGSITNATYTAAELSNIDFGSTSGAVNYVTISAWGTITRE